MFPIKQRKPISSGNTAQQVSPEGAHLGKSTAAVQQTVWNVNVIISPVIYAERVFSASTGYSSSKLNFHPRTILHARGRHSILKCLSIAKVLRFRETCQNRATGQGSRDVLIGVSLAEEWPVHVTHAGQIVVAGRQQGWLWGGCWF